MEFIRDLLTAHIKEMDLVSCKQT